MAMPSMWTHYNLLGICGDLLMPTKCENPDCCANYMHTMEVKLCEECDKEIRGGNCNLCTNCATGSNKCGHCKESL